MRRDMAGARLRRQPVLAGGGWVTGGTGACLLLELPEPQRRASAPVCPLSAAVLCNTHGTGCGGVSVLVLVRRKLAVVVLWCCVAAGNGRAFPHVQVRLVIKGDTITWYRVRL